MKLKLGYRANDVTAGGETRVGGLSGLNFGWFPSTVSSASLSGGSGVSFAFFFFSAVHTLHSVHIARSIVVVLSIHIRSCEYQPPWTS